MYNFCLCSLRGMQARTANMEPFPAAKFGRFAKCFEGVVQILRIQYHTYVFSGPTNPRTFSASKCIRINNTEYVPMFDISSHQPSQFSRFAARILHGIRCCSTGAALVAHYCLFDALTRRSHGCQKRLSRWPHLVSATSKVRYLLCNKIRQHCSPGLPRRSMFPLSLPKLARLITFGDLFCSLNSLSSVDLLNSLISSLDLSRVSKGAPPRTPLPRQDCKYWGISRLGTLTLRMAFRQKSPTYASGCWVDSSLPDDRSCWIPYLAERT